VKLEQGQWHNFGDKVAQERAGRTLRNVFDHTYQSSATAKRKHRPALLKNLKATD